MGVSNLYSEQVMEENVQEQLHCFIGGRFTHDPIPEWLDLVVVLEFASRNEEMSCRLDSGAADIGKEQLVHVWEVWRR